MCATPSSLLFDVPRPGTCGRAVQPFSIGAAGCPFGSAFARPFRCAQRELAGLEHRPRTDRAYVARPDFSASIRRSTAVDTRRPPPGESPSRRGTSHRSAAGDPAVDLAVAWYLFSAEQRETFFLQAGEGDQAMRSRSRAWAMALSLAVLANHTLAPWLVEICGHALVAATRG